MEKKSQPRWKQNISLQVRGWLQEVSGRYLIFLDDRERSRSHLVAEVFADYRSTITALLDQDTQQRAAVHFLVNMLEAYFFADPERASQALGWRVPKAAGDPEEIPNPYSDLIEEARRQGSSYGKKRESGERVLGKLRLEKLLENPEHCAWLRSAVRWIVFSLESATNQPEVLAAAGFRQLFHLEQGRIAPLTGAQEIHQPPPAKGVQD